MKSLGSLKFMRTKLSDSDTSQALATLSGLFATTIGPHGRIKLLRNQCGGHITLTTSSSRLLMALTPSNPLARLVLEAALKQSRNYGDGGLFTARFILILVEKALKLALSPQLIIKINSAFQGLLLSCLESGDFLCKAFLEMSDIDSLSRVASTMLSSKPLCQLDTHELNLISRVLLEVFITSLPSETENRPVSTTSSTHTIGLPGEATNKSFCCEGLLLEAVNIKELRTWLKNMNLADSSTSTMNFATETSACAIRTIVVDISMSGDSAELPEMSYVGTTLEDLEQSFLNHMELFCSQVRSEGVKVVFCQKVVHPQIKDQMRRNGILVIDRLGTVLCSKVITLTGSSPVSSFSSPFTHAQLGLVSKASIMEVYGKQWLHLERISSNMTTLVLCSYMEEQLEELKTNCSNVLLVFQHLLQRPCILYGGGCWQFSLANQLRTKVMENLQNMSKELQCTESQLLQVCDYFCTSLEQASSSPSSQSGMKCYTHPSMGHLWMVGQETVEGKVPNPSMPCLCGVVRGSQSDLQILPEEHFSANYGFKEHNKPLPERSSTSSTYVSEPKNPLLMDCFTPWKNAFETSILMANMALGTNQYIFETAHNL